MKRGHDKDVVVHRSLHVSAALILHGLAYLCLLLDESVIPHIDQLRFQLPFLFGLSLTLSMLVIVQRNAALRVVYVSARLLVVSVISYGLGSTLGVQLFLVVSIIFDAMFSLSFGATVAFSILSIVISVVIRQPISAWNVVNPGLSAADKVVLAAMLAMCGVFAGVLNLGRRRANSLKANLERLNAAVQNLSQANQGFQKYAISAQEAAAQSERNRITREVHDSVGYSLTNILMMARLGRRLVTREPPKVEEILDNIFQQAQEGLKEMRSALRILRAGSEKPVHGVKAIHRLINAFEASTGVHVSVDYANAGRLGGGHLDNLVFRVIQEGMTNSFRHGHATEIRIAFWQDSRLLHLRMSDNGNGSVNSSQGIGLSGMNERIVEIGGTLRTSSSKNGFVVTAELPILQSRTLSVDAYPVGG